MDVDVKKSVEDVLKTLHGSSFQYNSERELQNGMEDVFKASGFAYEREFSLGPRDIIDFLLFGCVGVEVKTKGSPNEVLRQLMRYAKCHKVTHLILVTGKVRLGSLPEELLGKPMTVVSLWKAFL